VIPQSPSAQDHKGIEPLPQNINNLLGNPIPPAIKVLILLRTEMLQPNISQKRTKDTRQQQVVNAFSSLITMWEVWRMGETTPCKLIRRPKPALCSAEKKGRVEVPIIVILLIARGQFKMSRFFHPMHT